MSKYGKNGTAWNKVASVAPAWNKVASVAPVQVVNKIVIDSDFRNDLSELDRDIFRLECSIKASMNTKVKGAYYGKKRGIVRTGRKEFWWREKGAFGNGVSDVEKERRKLIKLIALKIS